MRKWTVTFCVVTAGIFLAAGPARGAYQPWDSMVGDSWIFGNSTPAPRIYAVNSAVEYRVAFSTKKNNAGARGMNGLRFFEEAAAHHVTGDLAGSFTVQTMGGESYAALLVVVAIDAQSLPGQFGLTIAGHTFDPTQEFAYHDPTASDTGRPTGYYSQTSPTGSPISYLFDKGMVSVVAIEGLDFTKTTPSTVSYAFENLPGAAVFSVYGVDNDDQGLPFDIYHTNRGVEDLNDPGRGVSTFAVIPVPEPASLALIACVGAVLAVKRRR